MADPAPAPAYAVPTATLAALFTYLGGRPYVEVVALIRQLEQAKPLKRMPA